MHDPLRYRDAYHAALETAAPSEAERTWRRSRFDRGLRLVAELRRRHALAVEGLASRALEYFVPDYILLVRD